MKYLNSPSILFTSIALLVVTATAGARPVYGVAGRRGAAVVGENRAVVAGRRGVAVAGPNGAAVVRRPHVAPLPRGYLRVVPPGYRTVAYRGYSCFFVGGIYYRPVIYEGETVYVIVD